MLLSHISLQNYFENFPKSKINPYLFLFRPGGWPGRSTGSVPGQNGRPPGRPRLVSRTCTFVHVCRSTDRKQLALCFLSVDRPVDRQLKTVFAPLRPVDRPVDRGQRLSARWAYGRPGRSTDSLPGAPTALSSLVIFWNLFLLAFWIAEFPDLLGTNFGPYKLN